MPRGGKRAGAGRKTVKPQGKVDKAIATQVLDSIPEIEYWQDLIEAECSAVVGKGDNKQIVTFTDKRLRMEALKYLGDKRDGKAPQAIALTDPNGNTPVMRVQVELIGHPDSPSA